jgi:hypothetical protein
MAESKTRDPGVLGGLPRHRPQRRSRRRTSAPIAPPPPPRTKATRARPKPPPLAQPAQPEGAPPTPAGDRPRVAPEAESHGVLAAAVQAAGELGQLGLTLGRHVVGNALSRVPRP